MAVVAALALAGCGEPSGHARVLAASVQQESTPTLEARIDLALSPTMLEALDHGIPLTLAVRLRREAPGADLDVLRHLELSYSPLADRYRLLDLDTGVERSYAHRALLLAAFDRVRLPLDAAWRSAADPGRFRMRVVLERERLPAVLRLPAWTSREWRLATPEYAWTAGA